MSSIQELEKVNPDEFKDSPAELVKIAKNFLNLKKYEKGIELLEKAILFAIEKNKSETHIDCAKFYYHYADALIRKCMESDEILAVTGDEMTMNGTGSNPNPSTGNNINSNNLNNIQPVKDEPEITEITERNEEEEESQGEDEGNDPANVQSDDSDEQVALENLLFSEKIFKTFLADYDEKDKSELSEDVIKIYFDLAGVYQKFGELEMCKSDFKSAVDFFNKALDIRKKYDSPFSRAIAELYFNMATAYDFDSKKCLLCYYKTKIIMEYHLKQELNKINKDLADKMVILEAELEVDSVSITSENVKLNREVLESPALNNEQMLKNEEIEELVAIIQELNVKIDDVIIDISDFEKYAKEKEKLAQETNKFEENYDKSKVIDAQSLVRKRQRKDENKDDNEKEAGGKRVKFDLEGEKLTETKEVKTSNVTETAEILTNGKSETN